MKKEKIKLGTIMTIGQFLKKFKLWGFSISGALILIATGLAIWQKEADYVFYGIPAILFTLLISLPIVLLIVNSKEIEVDVVAEMNSDIPEPSTPVETSAVEIVKPEEVPSEIVQETTDKVDEIDYSYNAYEHMTVVQLREIAKQKGLSGYTTLKKSDLVELLKK